MYLWPDLEGIRPIPLCKGLEGNLGVGALARRGQEPLFQSRLVKDASPAARPFVDALSQFLDRSAFWVIQSTANEAIAGFGMDVVAGERPFPSRARPSRD